MPSRRRSSQQQRQPLQPAAGGAAAKPSRAAPPRGPRRGRFAVIAAAAAAAGAVGVVPAFNSRLAASPPPTQSGLKGLAPCVWASCLSSQGSAGAGGREQPFDCGGLKPIEGGVALGDAVRALHGALRGNNCRRDLDEAEGNFSRFICVSTDWWGWVDEVELLLDRDRRVIDFRAQPALPAVPDRGRVPALLRRLREAFDEEVAKARAAVQRLRAELARVTRQVMEKQGLSVAERQALIEQHIQRLSHEAEQGAFNHDRPDGAEGAAEE
eukprot:TRINITY_DN24036_c0_g2_i1.p1 TRINITY_DN24036_c0_g2~~TRINITY_DN24036_c0_g2_i1.p1  ORF type:complete len:297 (+),score=103.24 TRINITY_DN24036_c0_g2_i1:87-893(+)